MTSEVVVGGVEDALARVVAERGELVARGPAAGRDLPPPEAERADDDVAGERGAGPEAHDRHVVAVVVVEPDHELGHRQVAVVEDPAVGRLDDDLDAGLPGLRVGDVPARGHGAGAQRDAVDDGEPVAEHGGQPVRDVDRSTAG